MRQRLTVIIPCKNESANIGDCIASVEAIADEILVADSGSTDDTMGIARSMGARIVEREYIHSGDFKNWAIPQATHEWVLIVDSDERISPTLRAEIAEALESPEEDGYWIYRQNFLLGHPVRFSGWQTDKVLRLFRRDLGRYVGDTDHAEVAISTERVGRLRARMDHDTYASYDDYFRKFQRYTTQRAELWFAAGRKPSLIKMLMSVPFRFMQNYVFRLGFLDGKVGVQVCMLTAFYSFMKHVRLWELHTGRRKPQTQQPGKTEPEETGAKAA